MLVCSLHMSGCAHVEWQCVRVCMGECMGVTMSMCMCRCESVYM